MLIIHDKLVILVEYVNQFRVNNEENGFVLTALFMCHKFLKKSRNFRVRILEESISHAIGIAFLKQLPDEIVVGERNIMSRHYMY